MNFFEEQERARKKSGQLVFMFAGAVFITVLLLDIVAMMLVRYYQIKYSIEGAPIPITITDLFVFSDLWSLPSLIVSGTLISLIFLSSLFKVSQLSGGGADVAKSLGGREISNNTRDHTERKLMNVVEEMSIASGTPMPKVFVLDQELSINAFAAGNDINDAAVAVSRGAIEKLSRYELQGVIAHEFSHVFNGDMKMNVRVMGWIFGILVLATIGSFLIRTAGYGRLRSNRKNDSALPLIIAGVSLFVIGYIGVFVSRLIKAALSREREYLADASAVQFTRNPDGIGGALKKIFVSYEGSKIEHHGAEQASHFFFSDAVSNLSGAALATHPPMKERISAIYPNFNYNDFIKNEAKQIQKKLEQNIVEDVPGTSSKEKKEKGDDFLKKSMMAAVVVSSVGNPKLKHREYAKETMEKVPEGVRELCRDGTHVSFVVYFLFLDRKDMSVRKKQESAIGSIPDGVEKYRKELEALPRELFLPLVELALPVMKSLPISKQKELLVKVKELIMMDDEVDDFEFVYYSLLRYGLVTNDKKHKYKEGSLKLRKAGSELSILLSFLAHQGSSDPEKARESFLIGAKEIGDIRLTYLDKDKINISNLGLTLKKLSTLVYLAKEKVLTSCSIIILADELVTVEEKETLRTVSAVLGCPMPPII